ncbi:hypothetical protein [Streptomyces sp. NPDC003487]
MTRLSHDAQDTPRPARALRLLPPPAADALPAPPDDRLPDGFAVELAADTHRSADGRLLLGGSPPRLLRLTRAAARRLVDGGFPVTGPATAALARRLLDSGVAHPRPPSSMNPAKAMA